MIKAICLGHATYKITIRTDNMPVVGKNIRYEHKDKCGSGTSATVAYLLAKWGIETTFAGVIGNDNYGQEIRKELDSVNIDTRNLETTYENDTDLEITLINNTNNEVTQFTLADNMTYLKKLNFDFSPDLLILDGHDIPAAKAVLAQFPKAISVLYAKNLNANILELCKKVNFVICSKEFAEGLSGVVIDYENPNTLVDVYDKIKRKYEKTQVIVNLGENGALYCINSQIKVSPALKTENKDNSKRDDFFIATFIYQIANGSDIEKSIKFANIMSSLAVTTIGSRTNIPTLEEVQKLYEKNY